MKKKQLPEKLIKVFEESLSRYKKELKQNDGSLFHIWRVKNTEEFIEELKKQNNANRKERGSKEAS